MFVTDGVDDVAFMNEDFSFTDFTFVLWFRATSPGPRTLFGVATAAQASVFKCQISPGTFTVTLQYTGGNLYQGEWTTTDYLDDLWHCIVVRRDGDVITAQIDGAAPTAEGGTIDTAALPFTEPMAIGAVNVANASAEWYQGNFGQAAVWNVALSDEQLLLLAAGESPAVFTTGLVEHWRCFDEFVDSSGVELSFHRGTFNDEMVRGYRLYSKMGAAPEVGVDAPVMAIDADATDAEIAEAVLLLTVDGVAHIAVGAFGLGGYSDLTHASFLTDGSSHPLHVPSVVVIERVETMAAGKVRISFVYDEPLESLAMADNFRIVFVPLDGQTPVADVDVAARPPARAYSVVSPTLEDGDWAIEVYSEKDGNYREPGALAAAVADGTAPVGDVEALEVV